LFLALLLASYSNSIRYVFYTATTELTQALLPGLATFGLGMLGQRLCRTRNSNERWWRWVGDGVRLAMGSDLDI
jgi:hypothetical protein